MCKLEMEERILELERQNNILIKRLDALSRAYNATIENIVEFMTAVKSDVNKLENNDNYLENRITNLETDGYYF
ncbi:MAG: hypothetical protein MJ237_08590 [bacterium]|nr:hypothetical protein [bacterium]